MKYAVMILGILMLTGCDVAYVENGDKIVDEIKRCESVGLYAKYHILGGNINFHGCGELPK